MVQESVEQVRARVDAEFAARHGSSSSTVKRRKRKKRMRRRLPRTSSRPSSCTKLWRFRSCSLSTSSSSSSVVAHRLILMVGCLTFGGRCSCCARSSSFSAMACAWPDCWLRCTPRCVPFVADNSGSTRLVLLVTKHLTLYSLFPPSGPRCSTPWPVWTRRTVRRCIPVVALRLTPLVLSIVIPQLPSIDKVIDVPVGRFSSSTGAVCEKTAEISQLHLSYSCLDKVVHTPVVCHDRCLVVQSAPNCDVSAVAVLCHGEWGFFRALYTDTRPKGHVHRDTDPMIRCTVRSYRQRHVRYTGV